MKSLKVYVAGKISKESNFKTHHWRDEFCVKLSELSGIKLSNLDPISSESAATSIENIFRKDVKLINECELFIVYLSDDISVGGSQEILIAKYLKKPVIGFAPYGGKFKNATREMFGKEINDYKDPFVFSTCDIVCGTLSEVAEAVQRIDKIVPKDITIIDQALD